MTNAELLRRTEIFSKLSDDELAAVGRCVLDRNAVAGEVLIEEGKAGESLFIIRSGKVVVEKRVGDQKALLAELGDGDVFGEMSLIDNFPTSASVAAAADTSLLLVSRLDLNVLLTWDTVLGSKMWRSFTEMLCYRLRASNDKLLGAESPKEYISASIGIESKS